MVDKKEPKMVPTDIMGKPLPNLTEAEYTKLEEAEYERIIKTANKGIYNTWSMVEKRTLVLWAQKNYDTTLSEFKDIVEAFRSRIPYGGNKVLYSFQKSGGVDREIDVLCMFCARIHNFDVPAAARGWFTFDAPCVLSLRPKIGTLKVLDDTPIAKWEHKLLDDEIEKKRK